MHLLLKGLFYWALIVIGIPLIYIIALIALDLVRLRGRGRVAV